MIDDVLPLRASPRFVARIGAMSRLAALVAAAALLVGACGDDGGGAEAAGTTTSTVVDVATGSSPSAECPRPDGDLARFGSAVVPIATEGGAVEPCLLVADTLALRQRGLMEVLDLGPYEGMIFAYPESSAGGYWMRDTPMPLSIAWVSSDGEVVGTADMEPCLDPDADCPSSDPGASYQWAIEVPQGGLGAWGLVEGSDVDVAGWPVGQG